MKVFIFGEAMLEYHSHGGIGLRYGGDTLNTAIQMARCGCDVAYVTALGTDPISDALVAAWQEEGIDTAHVHRHPGRVPGIYAIHLDDAGERSFLYWRDRSAAREMFELASIKGTIEAALEGELVYFSLISLAILSDDGRRKLIELSQSRKKSGKVVAYDSNYRRSLWQSAGVAREWSMAAASTATHGLPTNVDERELFASQESEAAIAMRWRSAGCREVVVKAGEKGCVYLGEEDAAKRFAAPRIDVLDSSGAGDAFNAGYLTAILGGASRADAVQSGQACAARTLTHFGAIPPRDAMAPENRANPALARSLP